MFGHEKIFGQKKFLVVKKFCKKNLGHKNVLDHNIVAPRINWLKRFVRKNNKKYFGPEIFWSNKILNPFKNAQTS